MEVNEHYLYPGQLFAAPAPYVITTILGSCVSVCLWDPVLRIGGMNHYLLPFWNGDGLPSPKYGNIAIPKLIEKMLSIGSQRSNLKAKVFGGGAVLETSGGLLNVGERNIMLYKDLLENEKMPVLCSDTGGTQGRKVIFHSDTGEVFVKKIQKAIRPIG
ncbi:MAG: chemotaxis protein CheD [Nitrospirae bacterium]|nr:chemotaxis protein CheD [Nitrospirota bacterium]